MEPEQIVFRFFESRAELKEKFYDSLHRLIFDGDSETLNELLISYETEIVEFKKKKIDKEVKK